MHASEQGPEEGVPAEHRETAALLHVPEPADRGHDALADRLVQRVPRDGVADDLRMRRQGESPQVGLRAFARGIHELADLPDRPGDARADSDGFAELHRESRPVDVDVRVVDECRVSGGT